MSLLATGLWSVLLGLFVNTAAQSFLYATLPSVGRGIGLVETETGIILGGGALLGMLTAPLWGFLSERVGRRPVLVAAMSAVAVTPTVIALLLWGVGGGLAAFSVFLVVIVARSFQAAFSSALIPVTQAYAADITTPETRTTGMGLLSATISIGTIGGSVLVWIVGGVSPVLGFALLGVLAAFAFAMALFLLPEPRRHKAIERDSTRVPLGQIWPFLMVTAFAFTAYSTVQPTIGLRLMDQFGLDQAAAVGFAGASITAAAAAMFLSQAILTPRLRWPPMRMLVVGGTGAFAGLLGLTLAPTQPLMIAAMVVLGASLGLVVPANLAAMSLATGKGAQGKVAGINTVALGIGLALGPIAGTAIYRLNYLAPFWMAACLAAGIVAIALVAARREPAEVRHGNTESFAAAAAPSPVAPHQR